MKVSASVYMQRSESEPLHVASIYHLAQTSGISTQRWHNKGDAAVFSTGLNGVAKDDFINVMRRAYELGRADAAPVAAQPQQAIKPLSDAWQEGYKAGVEDERISESNIGIAGYGAKVNPARQNPYGIKERG